MSGTSRLCRVVLDTSALLIIGEHGSTREIADALEGVCDSLTLVILKPVLDEVSRIALEKGRRGLAARLFLKLVSEGYISSEVVEVKACGNTDECVLKYSLELKSSGERVIVATLDKELSERLKEVGIMYVTWWYSRKRFTLSSSP